MGWMNRLVCVLALTVTGLTGCQSSGDVNEEQLAAIANQAFELYVQYRALEGDRDAVLEAHAAETTVDRRRLARTALVAGRYLRAHEGEPGVREAAVLEATAWYESTYNEPFGALVSRLMGDGPDVPSDGELLLEVLWPVLLE